LLYICIPVHNEAATVGVLLWKIRQVMAGFGRDYQLLVLDDGSTDDTAEVLRPYLQVLPLHLMRHPERQGYAASMEALLREADRRSTHPRRDAAVVVQGDFTDPPEGIVELVKRLEGGADVVGPEDLVPEDAPRGLRWWRAGLGLLARGAGGQNGAGDPFAGFRIYRMNVIRQALREQRDGPLLRHDGWAANMELLLAVHPHARRAESAEVRPRPELRQRPSRFRGWGTIRDVWQVARGRGARRSPGPA
jgi:glycosyltransferase involved in cell wall biosynthesis